MLEVAHDVVLARAAQAGGKDAEAIALWQKAAETEDTIPYMEPPYWYYPVRRSLGAALLKSGQPAEAEKEFAAALGACPRRRAGALRAGAGGQGQR